jgi:hypothetical protein
VEDDVSEDEGDDGEEDGGDDAVVSEGRLTGGEVGTEIAETGAFAGSSAVGCAEDVGVCVCVSSDEG